MLTKSHSGRSAVLPGKQVDNRNPAQGARVVRHPDKFDSASVEVHRFHNEILCEVGETNHLANLGGWLHIFC